MAKKTTPEINITEPNISILLREILNLNNEKLLFDFLNKMNPFESTVTVKEITYNDKTEVQPHNIAFFKIIFDLLSQDLKVKYLRDVINNNHVKKDHLMANKKLPSIKSYIIKTCNSELFNEYVKKDAIIEPQRDYAELFNSYYTSGIKLKNAELKTYSDNFKNIFNFIKISDPWSEVSWDDLISDNNQLNLETDLNREIIRKAFVDSTPLFSEQHTKTTIANNLILNTIAEDPNWTYNSKFISDIFAIYPLEQSIPWLKEQIAKNTILIDTTNNYENITEFIDCLAYLTNIYAKNLDRESSDNDLDVNNMLNTDNKISTQIIEAIELLFNLINKQSENIDFDDDSTDVKIISILDSITAPLKQKLELLEIITQCYTNNEFLTNAVLSYCQKNTVVDWDLIKNIPKPESKDFKINKYGKDILEELLDATINLDPKILSTKKRQGQEEELVKALYNKKIVNIELSENNKNDIATLILVKWFYDIGVNGNLIESAINNSVANARKNRLMSDIEIARLERELLNLRFDDKKLSQKQKWSKL